MLIRLVVAWCLLLVLAMGNGAFREAVLNARLGPEVGHQLSTVSLCALILLATWLVFPWLGLKSRSAAFRTGCLWVALTIAFEFGAGHYLFEKSWADLLSDYDLAAGRIWLAVPVVTLLAPLAAGALRGALSSSSKV